MKKALQIAFSILALFSLLTVIMEGGKMLLMPIRLKVREANASFSPAYQDGDVLRSMHFIGKFDSLVHEILRIEFDMDTTKNDSVQFNFGGMVPTKVYVDTNFVKIFYIEREKSK